MKQFIKINQNDNVIVALQEIKAGETVVIQASDSQAQADANAQVQTGSGKAHAGSCQMQTGDFNKPGSGGPNTGGTPGMETGAAIAASEDIPAGHKMAVCDIPAGGEIIKYGFCIGIAKEKVQAGQWVHVHNIKTALGDLLEYTYEPVQAALEPKEASFFQGYRRKDGTVGIRNDVWIIPTVGCVNNVAQAIAARANATLAHGHTIEAIAFTHPYGCSQRGGDHARSWRT